MVMECYIANSNSSDGIDDTPSSDDYTSNGIIVWDPVAEIIGAKTLVIDLSVVAVDLIAQSDSIIVHKTSRPRVGNTISIDRFCSITGRHARVLNTCTESWRIDLTCYRD